MLSVQIKLIIFLFLVFSFTLFTTPVSAAVPLCPDDMSSYTPGTQAGDPKDCPSPPSVCFVYQPGGAVQCYENKPVPPSASTTTPTVQGTAGIGINPNPAKPNTEVAYAVSAKGFGRFSFYIEKGSSSLIALTISESGCQATGKGNLTASPKECKLLNKDEQTWLLNLNYRNGFSEGEHIAVLVDKDSRVIQEASLKVGNPENKESLKVNITTSETQPLKNDKEHIIKLEWSPVSKGEKYYITTNIQGILGLPIDECKTEPSCTREVRIPPATQGGDITFTVIQDGSPKKTGSATIKIEAVVAPDLNGRIVPGCKNKEDPFFNPANDVACTEAAGKPCLNGGGVVTALGCIPTSPVALIQGLLTMATAAAGGIALLLMAFGAIEMMTSAGNPDTLKKGQQQFTSAVIGLLFIIFSVLLLKIIGVDILGLKGFLGI